MLQCIRFFRLKRESITELLKLISAVIKPPDLEWRKTAMIEARYLEKNIDLFILVYVTIVNTSILIYCHHHVFQYLFQILTDQYAASSMYADLDVK